MEEITSQFPHTDRQHLRTLTRNAIRERRVLADNPQGKAPVQFRETVPVLKIPYRFLNAEMVKSSLTKNWKVLSSFMYFSQIKIKNQHIFASIRLR